MDTSVNGDDDVKNIMKLLAILFTAGFIIISVTYRVAELVILLPVAITLGTFSYHFLMRLIVGYGIDAVYHNRMNYHGKWFQPRKWENKLYKKLKVKSWKDKMPTYDTDISSFELHSMEEIVMAMCQSEIVHEIIVAFSFVPVLAIPWLGEPVVFIITSFLAACFDMIFVIMQRYNRPRIIKLIEKRRSRK